VIKKTSNPSLTNLEVIQMPKLPKKSTVGKLTPKTTNTAKESRVPIFQGWNDLVQINQQFPWFEMFCRKLRFKDRVD